MLTPSQINNIKQELRDQPRTLYSAFYALGDPGRLKIFKILLQYHDICVSEIASILDISVPAASRQLKILEQAGLALRERKGQMICYWIPKRNLLVQLLIKIINV